MNKPHDKAFKEIQDYKNYNLENKREKHYSNTIVLINSVSLKNVLRHLQNHIPSNEKRFYQKQFSCI